MMLLAKKSGQQALTLPEISGLEGLSIPYVAKLLAILKQAGLVNAVRGRHGGYVLARPAEGIYLKEILDCLGESVFNRGYCERHTGDLESCVHSGDCGVSKIWAGLDKFLSAVFNRVTLADLAYGNLEFLNQLNIDAGRSDGDKPLAIGSQ